MSSEVSRLTAEVAAKSARIADLEAALGLGDNYLGVMFKLPNSQRDLLGCLMSMPQVTADMISLRLGIASDAKVAMHRLRAALAHPPDDPTRPIKIQSRRGLGYWLDPADKERVRRITHGVTNAAPAATKAA